MSRSRFFVSALLAFGALSAVLPAHAEPAIWKVSDADSSVWLFGSMHFLPADARWRTPKLEGLLKTTEAIYFETDTGSAAQAQIQALVPKLGLNPEGGKLSDQLTAEQWAALSRVSADLGAPVESLQPLRPWLANLTLSQLLIQKLGFSPDTGVERTLAPLADDDKTRYLETAEEQMRFFAEATQEVQVGALVSTVDRYTEAAEVIRRLGNAWVAGDMATVDALLNEQLRDVQPEVYERLIVQRNRDWLPELQRLLEGNEEALVVVGAGHLVGDAGVPALLQARGLKVERVQ